MYLLLLCPPISFATEKDDTKRLKISIYNEANFHGEVWPAFAYTLLESGHDVDVYAMDSAQRMSDAIKTWFPRDKVMHPKKMHNRLCHYDIIIFITMQQKSNKNAITTLQIQSQRFNPDQMLNIIEEKCPQGYLDRVKIFGIVHDPAHEDRGVVMATRVPNFVTLSQHVTSKLEEVLASLYRSKRRTEGNKHGYTFTPIFPIDKGTIQKRQSGKNADFSASGRISRKGVVIQGTVSPKRRDYSAFVKEALRDPIQQSRRFNLTILGSNADRASQILNIQHPQFDSTVSRMSARYYVDFYGVLMNNMALYPAFLNDSLTLTQKASSTIPCSFISDIPLLANKAILEAYSYIDEESVFLESTSTGSLFDGLHSITPTEFESKLQALERNRIKIYQSNLKTFEEMLASAVLGVNKKKQIKLL